MRSQVLGFAVAVAALMPAITMADDRQIAEFVKSRLNIEQQRGSLRGFNVDMRVERGTVWFTGFVSNAAQEQLILRTAQLAGHLGVVQVVDDIEIQNANLAVVDYRQPIAPQTPSQNRYQNSAYQPTRSMGYQGSQLPDAPIQFAPPQDVPLQAVPMPQAISMMQASPAPQLTNEPAYPVGSSTGEPMPFATAAPVSTPMPMAMSGAVGVPTEAPHLPGYAWPCYAAFPNYAAVTYPKMYSPSAWPYIGPFYPYPQVPLGWRRVALEWDDGWWFLDFQDRNHHND
jgi:hypothetical protein